MSCLRFAVLKKFKIYLVQLSMKKYSINKPKASKNLKISLLSINLKIITQLYRNWIWTEFFEVNLYNAQIKSVWLSSKCFQNWILNWFVMQGLRKIEKYKHWDSYYFWSIEFCPIFAIYYFVFIIDRVKWFSIPSFELLIRQVRAVNFMNL